MKKLLTLLAFAFVAFTANAQSTQKGDINGDGDVSVNDVAMIVNYILGITDSNFIIANADVNGDGEITIADVMGTVSTILGDNGGGNQGEKPLLLSHYKSLIVVGSHDYITILSGSGSYTVVSSNEAIATANININTYYDEYDDTYWSEVIVTAKKVGQTTITITDVKSGQAKTIQVEVVNSLLKCPPCPDNNHPHALDLGLPSGTKWACCDLGASSPTKSGLSFAWGETKTKEEFTLDNYEYAYYVEDPNGYWDKDLKKYMSWHTMWEDNNITNIIGTQYDAAKVLWGGGWQMPSCDQFEELLIYSKYEIFKPQQYVGHNYWLGNRKDYSAIYSDHLISLPAGVLLAPYVNSVFLTEFAELWAALEYEGHLIRPVWVP